MFQDCVPYRWMQVYTLLMIVILPSVICLALNLVIFRYVRSSSHRIQPVSHITQDESVNHQPQRINRRDIHLLRHIIFMFCVFIGGWAPVYIFATIITNLPFDALSICALIVLAELSLLVNVINLFVYNHELRRHLFNKICKCQ